MKISSIIMSKENIYNNFFRRVEDLYDFMKAYSRVIKEFSNDDDVENLYLSLKHFLSYNETVPEP